jgi:hypothetical protein
LYDAPSKENENFHIVFSIYWFYPEILNLAYRQFINTLTDNVQNVVRNQQFQNLASEAMVLVLVLVVMTIIVIILLITINKQ